MIEPWGTPALIDFDVQAAPGSTTLCFWSAKYFWTIIIENLKHQYIQV